MVTEMVNNLAVYLSGNNYIEHVYHYQAPVASLVKRDVFAVVAAPNQVMDAAERGNASKSTMLRLSLYYRCDVSSLYPTDMDDIIVEVSKLLPYTTALSDKRTITYEPISVLPPVFDGKDFYVYNIILRTTLNY